MAETAAAANAAAAAVAAYAMVSSASATANAILRAAHSPRGATSPFSIDAILNATVSDTMQLSGNHDDESRPLEEGDSTIWYGTICILTYNCVIVTLSYVTFV
jgi:hypothetical protein